ncbi:MAG: hypothetical protein OXE94_14680 [Aestuariivita sp.]|nr:hypothetical protein [Aestuariivita sp.]MCY4203091.1 hypothetical protein [Aestuariivita sp.]MCY4287149.1 hypothetical protein [Aestuariivita sp.]MCY4347570.1 hypothetical protein [Aestuariivita sp.]
MENDLITLNEGLSQKNRLQSDDMVLEKIGRLHERYALVGYHDEIKVTPSNKRRIYLGATTKRHRLVIFARVRAAFEPAIPTGILMKSLRPIGA